MEPLKIGVLLSGSGTNLQAIIDAVRDEGLPVDIVKVISSRPDAYGIERARAAGIPAVALNRDVYADPLAADARIVEELRAALADAKRQTVPTLIDIKVVHGSMSHGYDAWWRVGVAEVSASETVQKAYGAMQENIKKARLY